MTPSRPPSPPAPRPLRAGFIRVHYSRRDRNYGGWGLHVWGKGLGWARPFHEPLFFEAEDDFGPYVDFEVQDRSKPLNFIVHRGGEKDVSADRVFPELPTHHEYWLKQGRADVWVNRPHAPVEIIRAEIVARDEIVALADEELSKYARLLEHDQPRPMPHEASGDPERRPHERILLQLESHDGVVVPIVEERHEGRLAIAKTAWPLDLSKNYFVSLGISRAPAYLAGGILDSEFYYDGDDLGARLHLHGVTFKLWSPPATEVRVHLYDRHDPQRELSSWPLTRGARGVWSVALAHDAVADPGGLEGLYYQYEVTALGQTRRALDPYAFSMAAHDPEGADPLGKAAIVDPRHVDPVDFAADHFTNFGSRFGRSGWARLANPADMVAYELHVRDATIAEDSGVPEEIRGTYRGLAHERPLNYLERLGVSHVQLLPVHAYHTVNESDRRFRGPDATHLNYNWGYDPLSYFAPSGWLSSNAHDPYARIRELKELVLALHRRRIGVILDVVYNHVYEVKTFENVAPGCYLRYEHEGLISNRTGAGPSFETRRRMARKLIVDSIRHYAREYHIDGFRFDLLGFLDNETILAIREALGPDHLLHGEAWDMTDLPPDQATTKFNLPPAAQIAAFSDSTRDSFAGRMSDRGWVQGAFWEAPRVRAGVIGNIRDYLSPFPIAEAAYDRFAREPIDSLNYLSIHDGFTLWDKLKLSNGGTAEELARVARLSMAMLLTAQGRVILQGGDEFGRTKPLAPNDPNPGRAHGHRGVIEDPDLPGVTRFHENTYSSPDWTNMVRWSRLEREPFHSMAAYLRDLIRLRRLLPGLRYATAAQVQKGLTFIGAPTFHGPSAQSALAGYTRFADIPELTLEFVHGPPFASCHLAGEIFAGQDKNPADNPYIVHFNGSGIGRIHLTREQLAQADLAAWGDETSLQVKLVWGPARWDSPPNAYSHMGANTIAPAAVALDNSVVLDLAVPDHEAGTPGLAEWSYMAYELDNTIGARGHVDYDRLIVVHNAGRHAARVQSELLDQPSHWRVLLDAYEGEPEGLAVTEVAIDPGALLVPPKSSAIIGRRAVS